MNENTKKEDPNENTVKIEEVEEEPDFAPEDITPLQHEKIEKEIIPQFASGYWHPKEKALSNEELKDF